MKIIVSQNIGLDVFLWIKYIFFVDSVKTEATSNGALSRLYIANANRNDSGNYTCSLADVATSAVSVHVLRGMLKNIYERSYLRKFIW